jgi:hypothetical protein
MLKDYKNKEVLAEMKCQVNAAAKISNREARIIFELVHMISEYGNNGWQMIQPVLPHQTFRS